jgi:hypothetical protein
MFSFFSLRSRALRLGTVSFYFHSSGYFSLCLCSSYIIHPDIIWHIVGHAWPVHVHAGWHLPFLFALLTHSPLAVLDLWHI